MITPKAYERFTREWLHAGCTIVGGCCGVGPEHMRAVSSAVSGYEVSKTAS